MKRHILLLGFFPLLVACLSPRTAASAPDPLRGLDTYFEKSRIAWNVPGLAVAIVKDGKVVFLKGYGVREAGKTASVDEHTIFALASTTKAVTADAMGMLVDEEKLAWDDPVIKHLPWFQLPDPWVTREVTLRDLLSHRVGVGGSFLLPAVSLLDREEVIRRLRYIKPDKPFRSEWSYSNLNYAAAGLIIGAASGMSWDDFVRTRIFQPLGMNESFASVEPLWDRENLAPCFLCDLPGRKPGIQHAKQKNIAMSHLRTAQGPQVIPWRNYDNVGPAGAVSSSAADWAKWVKWHLARGKHDGRQLLSDRTLEQMYAPRMMVPAWRSSEKDAPDGHFVAYGLGWGMFDYRGRKVISFGGTMHGFSSHGGLMEEENLGVVVLCNMGAPGLPPALMKRIFDAYLGAPERDWSHLALDQVKTSQEKEQAEEQKVEAARVKGTKPSLPLNRYAGTYADRAYGTVQVSEQGEGLVLRFPGAQVADLKHWHYDLFRMSLRGPATGLRYFVTFILDETGKISEMRIKELADFQRIESVPESAARR